MKSETPNRDDGRLNQLLHEWKVDSSLPPRFSEQVWRRIERQQELDAPAAGPLANLQMWIAAAFARPSVVVSYATVLLVAGMLAGFWQAHITSRQTTEALSARYVQRVDPYQTPHH